MDGPVEHCYPCGCVGDAALIGMPALRRCKAAEALWAKRRETWAEVRKYHDMRTLIENVLAQVEREHDAACEAYWDHYDTAALAE